MRNEKVSELHASCFECPKSIPDLRSANAERFSYLGSGCRTDHVDMAILVACGTRLFSAVALYRFALPPDSHLHPLHFTGAIQSFQRFSTKQQSGSYLTFDSFTRP